jgi:methionine synthase II (cobalamin-independent)
MRSSKDRILTTHAGSLSRPANLIAMGRTGAAGKNEDKVVYADCLADAVADVVRKQRELGIDIRRIWEASCGRIRLRRLVELRLRSYVRIFAGE